MKHLAVLILGLMLGACTTLPNGCLRLAPDGWYCPAFATWPAFETEQATTVRFRDQSMQLLTRIQSDREGVRLVAVSPLGQTILAASWQGGQLNATLPPGLNDKLEPALLPALLEIALAPAPTVRAGLGGALEIIDSAQRRDIVSARGTEIAISWQGAALPYDALRINVRRLGLVIESQSITEEEP